MKAPTFSLQDQNGVVHRLEDYHGKWLVLYFYPKDDTPGCTKEACSFRDNFSALKDQGVEIIGISADTVHSHKKFAEKYHLSFPLLSDPEKTTIQAYDAWAPKKMFGREFLGIIRKTFIIDPNGEIAKEYPEVTPDKHAEEILKDIEVLKKTP